MKKTLTKMIKDQRTLPKSQMIKSWKKEKIIYIYVNVDI